MSGLRQAFADAVWAARWLVYAWLVVGWLILVPLAIYRMGG